MHPYWIAFPAAVLPALLGAWWSRRVPADPAVLPEWNHALSRRVSVAVVLCTVVIFATAGDGGPGLLALELLAVSAVRHRTRRALFDESWPYWRFLTWQVRAAVAALGFWIFIALAPALVVSVSQAAAWTVALACMAAGGLWLHFHAALVIRLLGGTRLVRPDLERPFAGIFERSTISPPSVWRAGPRGGALANALALPSVRGDSVILFDTLLDRLAPDETTAVLAHEVAHLEYFATRRYRMFGVSVAATIGVLAVAAWIATRDPDRSWMMTRLWPLLAFGALYLRATAMQAHETRSDLRAVELCGNAEALIGALVRLHALNHVPRRLSGRAEQLATHPSLARRIRDIRERTGPGVPRSFGGPTVVASSDRGRFAIFGETHVSLVWSDAGPSESREAIRNRARRIESAAYADVTELRLVTSTSGIALVMVDRGARRSTLPLPPGEAARVQGVLDVVDQWLARPTAARTGTTADRVMAAIRAETARTQVVPYTVEERSPDAHRSPVASAEGDDDTWPWPTRRPPAAGSDAWSGPVSPPTCSWRFPP